MPATRWCAAATFRPWTLSNRLADGGLYQFLQRGGVDLPKPPGYYGLALALGRIRDFPGTTGGLYAGLADDGLPRPLVFSRRGKAANSTGTPLLSAQARFLMLDMLRGAADLGIDDGFSRSDPSVAWKTGTSHGFRDAWAVGVRGDHVLVVWLGNFNGRGNNALVARRCAVPLMFDLFGRLRPAGKARRPAGTGSARWTCARFPATCRGHGANNSPAAGSFPACRRFPCANSTAKSWSMAATGMRVARDDGRPGLRREIHEFWPPDLLELFRKAGLPRRLPRIPRTAPTPWPGSITATRPGSFRRWRAGSIGPAEVRKNPGFRSRQARLPVSEASIGSRENPSSAACPPGDSLAWKAPPGNHTLRVLDDHGRSAQAPVRVTRE